MKDKNLWPLRNLSREVLKSIKALPLEESKTPVMDLFQQALVVIIKTVDAIEAVGGSTHE